MTSTTLISQQAFEEALAHVQTLEQHGKGFEKIARSLEERLLTREAEFIERIAQQIQQQGRIAAALLERSLENKQYSLEKYILVRRYQYEAILLYIEAIKVMTRLI